MDKYVMILDTETTNSLDDPIVYDIGFAVLDTESGELVENHSYVVADVFLDKELMASAFYSDKIPQYWKDIKSGKRIMRRYKTIRFIIADVCRQYDIKIVAAHNARFDNRSTNLTQRFLTNSKYRFFIPYGVQWWDTLKMAREVFKANEQYDTFCYENDYLTERNCKRYTAEILYRFLHNDTDFMEEHTALEDAQIESEIFMVCLRANENINGKLWDK